MHSVAPQSSFAGGGIILNFISQPTLGQNRFHCPGDGAPIVGIPVDRIAAKLLRPEGNSTGLKCTAAGNQHQREPVIFRSLLPYPVRQRYVTGSGHRDLRPVKFPKQRLLTELFRRKIGSSLRPDYRHDTLLTGQRLAIPAFKILVLQYDLKSVEHSFLTHPAESVRQLHRRAAFARYCSSQLLQYLTGVLGVLFTPHVDPVIKGRMAYIIVAYQRLIEGEGHQNQRRTHRKA